MWLPVVQAQEIFAVGHHDPACSLGVGQELGISGAEQSGLGGGLCINPPAPQGLGDGMRDVFIQKNGMLGTPAGR